MKQILLTLTAVALCSLQLEATVLTVSNHPTGGAQYSNLTAAYNAALAGDTLLIEGTDFDYYPYFGSQVNWNKPLVVIGTGFNPQTQVGKRVRWQNTQNWGEFRLNGGAAGTKFYGIHFIASYGILFHTSVSDIQFENCLFDRAMQFNNVVSTGISFNNCIFSEDNAPNVYLPGGSTYANAIFTSCIFDGYIHAFYNPTLSIIINHCIFLVTNNCPLYQFSSASNISNSIFMNYACVTNGTGGTYNNNIARLATVMPPAGNSGTSNLSLTDPNFVTYTLGALYSTSHDYALQAGSPAIGAASDATDIGVHGGTSGFSESGEPLIAPVVRSVNVQNPSVISNGTLNVIVTAGKPNDD